MREIAVILTAAAGDGTKEVVTGWVNSLEEIQLEFIERIWPQYVTLAVFGSVCHCEPSGARGLLDHVKWWMLSGNDTQYEEIKNLPIDQFCNHSYVKEQLWA